MAGTVKSVRVDPGELEDEEPELAKGGRGWHGWVYVGEGGKCWATDDFGLPRMVGVIGEVTLEEVEGWGWGEDL